MYTFRRNISWFTHFAVMCFPVHLMDLVSLAQYFWVCPYAHRLQCGVNIDLDFYSPNMSVIPKILLTSLTHLSDSMNVFKSYFVFLFVAFNIFYSIFLISVTTCHSFSWLIRFVLERMPLILFHCLCEKFIAFTLCDINILD